MSKPTVANAIAAILDACEFALQVLGDEEMGPDTVLGEDAARRLEAVCRLTHALEQAKAIGAGS